MAPSNLQRGTLALTPRDWREFLVALDRAERPRPKLEAAARRYRERRVQPVAVVVESSRSGAGAS